MTVLVQSQGDACGASNNSYGATAVVNGNQVAVDVDYNNADYKAKTMTFPVPNGGSFYITYQNNGCNTLSTIWEYY
jgi:hypothetical protein